MPNPPKPAASPSPNAPVVLIVEDDADIRAMLVKALGPKYRVYQAADGLEAEQLLPQLPAPAALICDVTMPRMNGLDLVRRLRENTAFTHIPVLFLTARTGVRDVVSGINLGARHYVTKPFKLADVVAKVDSMVRKSMA
jgi:DNA-binding response OmpR family regulator